MKVDVVFNLQKNHFKLEKIMQGIKRPLLQYEFYAHHLNHNDKN